MRYLARLVWPVVALLGSLSHAAASNLPVWIEESHAGSFYFLAQILPLNQPHTLVLFDAHSDASAIAKSDVIREAIRKVPSVEGRAAKLQRWREQGAIQCFNWIEPLMPAPITEVWWISSRKLSPEERAQREQDAREFLDAHEEGLPRNAGPLAPRFRALDFEQWLQESAAWPAERPLVASIDLDYFAALPDEKLAPEVREVVSSVLKRRGLKALCWALSTPWMKSQAQADTLLHLALDESWRIANADLRWEPFAVTGPDRSMMAKLRQRKGEEIPTFDLSQASPALRSKVLQRWRPAHTADRTRLADLLEKWRADSFLPEIRMTDRPREPDGSYSLEAGKPGQVQMTPPPTGARVRWWALQSTENVYRVSDLDFGFASTAPRWIQTQPQLLAEGPVFGTLDTAALRPALDAKHHCGTTTLYAEVIRDGESRFSNLLTLRVRAASSAGLQAAWSEQFALPYVFGCTWLSDGRRSGTETGWGADCANLLIGGLRARGWNLPWGAPRDLRDYLEPWSGPVDAAKGCFIDFGSHVAALWEDRPPLGTLTDDDLTVHQLEGRAEIIPLRELKRSRPAPKILQLRQPTRPLSLIIGGDVMMGRRVAPLLDQGINPLASLKDTLQSADLAVVNLETALLPPGAGPDAKAPLAAPDGVANLLKGTGVDAVTLANNHTLDRGATGLQNTQTLLDAAGVKYCGHPVHQKSLQPLILQAQGRKIATFSVFISEADDAPPFPQEALVQAIQATSQQADLVIVLPHWGQEHSQEPTAMQRQLASQWLNAGAHIVAGSGPHVVQPLERQFGGAVAWSLGNLVFDGPGPDKEWSRGALLRLTWNADSLRLIRSEMLPVDISDEGRASLVEAKQ